MGRVKVEQGLDLSAACHCSTIPLHGSVELVITYQEQGGQGRLKVTLMGKEIGARPLFKRQSSIMKQNRFRLPFLRPLS
jgi:hypothetical protein